MFNKLIKLIKDLFEIGIVTHDEQGQTRQQQRERGEEQKSKNNREPDRLTTIN